MLLKHYQESRRGYSTVLNSTALGYLAHIHDTDDKLSTCAAPRGTDDANTGAKSRESGVEP